jgi:hypothetical protein
MSFNSRFNLLTKNGQKQGMNNGTAEPSFSNLIRQKIDFKGCDINDSSNPSLSNTLSIFKLNSPKNGFENT